MEYDIELTAEGILRAYETEKGSRATLEGHWRDLAKYTMPRKDNILSVRTPEQKLDNEEIYDDTAIQANVTLSNGLQTNLTPPNVKWFNLRARDEELNNDEAVREYFSVAGEQVFKTLGGSNFSEQIHENYLDLGCFGTSCIFLDEDPIDDIRFYALSVPKGVYVFEDSKGRVNKVIREVEFTTLQALEEFGEQAGESVQNCYKEKNYTKAHVYLHCVGERHMRDPGKKDSKNKPIYSVWVSKQDKKIVKEGGYEEMPFYVSRFYKNDSTKYGFSPNMMCLPTIKSANRTMGLLLQASDQSVRPPLDVPFKGYMGTINLNPGKVNYRRQGMTDNDRIKPIELGQNFPASWDMLLGLREFIKQAYFVNMFLSLENKTNMTATEVAERINEKMAQLGPALKRLENEMLQGIIHRVFMILIRRGKIPMPPEALLAGGLEYDIAYTSRLELAQKMAEIQTVDQFINRLNTMSQFNPEVLDNLDWDEAVKYYERSFNTPPNLTKRPEDVQKIRQQRAEMQQQQMALQAMQIGSQAGKNIASAQKDSSQAEALGAVA